MKKNWMILCLTALLFTACAREEKLENIPDSGPIAMEQSPMPIPELTTESLPETSPLPETEGEQSVRLKDGVYTAKADEESTERLHGWRDELRIEFQNGHIKTVEFDARDAKGRLKSSLTRQEYPMDPFPADWIPELEKQILSAYKPEDIKGITGASISSANARKMFEEILEKAKE